MVADASLATDTELVEPVRICFVCLGNICRSPMAESVLRQRVTAADLADIVVVDSAGTGAWHVGGPADERARRTLLTHGYDAESHVARQFTAESFAHYDLVLVLDRDIFADLNALAPDDDSASKLQMFRAYDDAALDAGTLDVPDPYYGGQAGFDDVLALIERAADGLVATLQRELAS